MGKTATPSREITVVNRLNGNAYQIELLPPGNDLVKIKVAGLSDRLHKTIPVSTVLRSRGQFDYAGADSYPDCFIDAVSMEEVRAFVTGVPTVYVVCNRMLDPETDMHCEFDGEVAVSPTGNWVCPVCKGNRYHS